MVENKLEISKDICNFNNVSKKLVNSVAEEIDKKLREVFKKALAEKGVVFGDCQKDFEQYVKNNVQRICISSSNNLQSRFEYFTLKDEATPFLAIEWLNDFKVCSNPIFESVSLRGEVFTYNFL